MGFMAINKTRRKENAVLCRVYNRPGSVPPHDGTKQIRYIERGDKYLLVRDITTITIKEGTGTFLVAVNIFLFFRFRDVLEISALSGPFVDM